MPDKKDPKSNATSASRVTGINESKVPEYKFTPPPPKVKDSDK